MVPYTMVNYGRTVVYHGIPWYTMVNHFKLWYDRDVLRPCVYRGIPWYTWYTTVYHGKLWYHSDVLRHGRTVVYRGIPR